jgi:hypothetical protein
VPVLRRSHDRHREVPARLLAAHPSRGIHRRDQDRHIMIKVAAPQKLQTASLLRRISTGNDQARPRTARDCVSACKKLDADQGSILGAD